MRNKALLMVAIAAILAVPTGIALATVDMDQWVQDRAQSRAQCDDCTRIDEIVAPMTTIQAQDQVKQRSQLHDPTQCEADGAQLRTQQQLHKGAQSGQGMRSGQHQTDNMSGPYRGGPLDGTGPIHSPLDGVRS